MDVAVLFPFYYSSTHFWLVCVMYTCLCMCIAVVFICRGQSLMRASSMFSTLLTETWSPTELGIWFQLDCVARKLIWFIYPAPNTGLQVCTIIYVNSWDHNSDSHAVPQARYTPYYLPSSGALVFLSFTFQKPFLRDESTVHCDWILVFLPFVLKLILLGSVAFGRWLDHVRVLINGISALIKGLSSWRYDSAVKKCLLFLQRTHIRKVISDM